MSDLKVTLIQTQLHWEDKEANLRMFDEKINSIKERTEVVFLPEMFSTGFSMQSERLAETMDGSAVQWMKKKAAENALFKEILESQIAFARRTTQWEQDTVVNRRMAYEHYFGPNGVAKKT